MSRSIRVCVLLLAYLVSACGEFNVDDQDLSDNRRNLDVTNDNAEELLWSAYQAAYSPFYYARVDQFLDASGLVASSSPVTCSGGGSYTANYPNSVGDEYRVQDAFSIEFDECVRSNGIQLNGLITGRYLEIEGYNTEFSNVVDIDHCASRVVRDEFDGSARVIADQAEMILFDKQGPRLFVRYLNANPTDRTEVVEHAVYELSLSEEAVVLNSSSTVSGSVLDADGASIYKVSEGLEEKVDCTYYERQIDLDLASLTLAASDSTRILNGSVTLTHTQNRAENKILRITSEAIASSLVLGNLSESYTLNDFEWRMEYDEQSQATYGAYFDAELVNNLNGAIGEVRVSNGVAMRGALAELHPSSGILSLDGINDENAAMNVNNASSITFAIEADGDQTGDGRGDKTAENFDLSWVQFLNREFVRPPVIPVEQPDSGSNPDFGNLLP